MAPPRQSSARLDLVRLVTDKVLTGADKKDSLIHQGDLLLLGYQLGRAEYSGGGELIRPPSTQQQQR